MTDEEGTFAKILAAAGIGSLKIFLVLAKFCDDGVRATKIGHGVYDGGRATENILHTARPEQLHDIFQHGSQLATGNDERRVEQPYQLEDSP